MGSGGSIEESAWSTPDTRLPSEVFLDKHLASDFDCPICLMFVRNPMQCENEHVFCEACIHNHLEVVKQECACCKEPLTRETLRRPPRFYMNQMSKLRVQCPMYLKQ